MERIFSSRQALDGEKTVEIDLDSLLGGFE